MKLKTKFQDEDFELGEVVDMIFTTSVSGGITLKGKAKSGGLISIHYKSLKELYENWEDVPEEQEEYYFIRSESLTVGYSPISNTRSCRNRKEIGNYFETEEEAERAVEKLKAWKRLKDNGFEFLGIEKRGRHINFYQGRSYETNKQCYQAIKDLGLIFGGKE